MQRLLLVEDEAPIVQSLTPALQAEGYAVTAAERGADVRGRESTRDSRARRGEEKAEKKQKLFAKKQHAR